MLLNIYFFVLVLAFSYKHLLFSEILFTILIYNFKELKMFLGDRGKPNNFHCIRMNYDPVIDNEKYTVQKLMNRLGFYTIIYQGRVKEIEVVYDTDRKLMTGAGLILRKKTEPKRTYFSLVRISSMKNVANREKKSFLGECEPKDQPSNFPMQIANAINNIFNNVFTIDLVDIVKHTFPYIKYEIYSNKYKIVSGTGYEMEMTFETLKICDLRTGVKAKKRNFSLYLEKDPNYEKERLEILETIEKWCKELVFLNRNRFEIAEIAVRVPEVEGEVNSKDGKKKKSKKELKQELENKSEEQ